MVQFGTALGLISGLPRLAADVTALNLTCLDLAGIGFDFWLRPGMANIAELEFLPHGKTPWQATTQCQIRFVQRPRSNYGTGTRGRQNSVAELTSRRIAFPGLHILVTACHFNRCRGLPLRCWLTRVLIEAVCLVSSA